jgi:predicted nucleic-acid-binding protein
VNAIDTNVVIRLVTRDDAPQLAVARQLLAEGDLFVSFGVLMECEWVLRSQYRMNRQDVSQALSAFVQLVGIQLPDREGVRWALSRHGEGADLADMLHLVDSGTADGFATFDQNVIAQAGSDAPLPIITL